MFQEKRGYGRDSEFGCEMQGRPTIVVPGFQVGTGVQQELRVIGILQLDCPV